MKSVQEVWDEIDRENKKRKKLRETNDNPSSRYFGEEVVQVLHGRTQFSGYIDKLTIYKKAIDFD